MEFCLDFESSEIDGRWKGNPGHFMLEVNGAELQLIVSHGNDSKPNQPWREG